MKLLLILLLTAVCGVISLIIYEFFALSQQSLKKKALSGNKHARKLYRLEARKNEVLVILIAALALVTVVIGLLLDSILPSFLAALLGCLLVAGGGIILPIMFFPGKGLRLASILAIFIERAAILAGPVARPAGRRLAKVFDRAKQQIYSKAQLYKLFELHQASPDSDIEQAELEMVKHVLEFGDKTIREIMTPRRMMKLVAAEATVGTGLLEELHGSGHSRFPVYAGDDKENITGTLYLRDLVKAKTGGKVKDLMHKNTYYVHEELPLAHGLQAFLKTKHHLFLVTNNFAEVVGLVSLEDIIEQIVGKQIIDEFDAYDSLRAVAELRAEKELAAKKTFNPPKTD
jgi:CBS domain containing-hemolysin-like protein